ncbi:MAG: SigB/SigF/SigG family RNA polymerase sigma factor [Clostridia bacterium]|nr:SigB/SigF/SigG family RNA polymerase sigma factor [Clostridia bacterium]
MLNNEDTLKYIKQAQDGEENAKTILIEENSPLIKSVIRRFKNKNIEYDDLYQIGCMGFLKAIRNFKTDFNVKFSTYVVPMIIGEIKRFLRDDGIIKVSRNIKTQNVHIKRYVEKFSKENQRQPTLKEISKEFNIEENELVFIMDSARMPVSIYTPYEGEESGLYLIDRYVQNDEPETLIDKLVIKDALNQLDERERKLVLLRYFRDKTQSEIAEVLNISQVQVSRLENKILNILKDKLKVINTASPQ